jgi:hypothetical protein
MAKKKFQAIFERSVLVFCALLLAYLIVRTYVLSQTSSWDNIRGPLAPEDYYMIGELDEPIPSEEFLPYTFTPTPEPQASSAPAPTPLEKARGKEESAKE